MGLKCSVLGHKYGDTTVERDREEQGSEVVITIQETETCERCGAERVVSENKEVTSIATPDDPVPAGDAPDAGEGPAEDADAGEPSVDEEGTDGAAGASDEADDEAAAPADADDAPAADAPEPDEGAEILDAESEEPVDDELADPSVDPAEDDAEDDDPPVEEDAVIMGEDGDEGDHRDGRAPGEWPEEPGTDDQEWSPDDIVDDQHTITAPDAGTEENGAVTVPEGEFACPECGYTTSVEASSLRAGDFCPECRKGALVHRAEDAHDEE